MRASPLVLTFVLIAGCSSTASPHASPFAFNVDERLFTANAFMNAAGYDLEYRKDGMHPMRNDVRARLEAELPRAYRDSIHAYYDSHPHYLGYYGTYAFALSAPPALQLHLDSASSSPWVPGEVAALPGLDGQLGRFYQRAHIADLWREYRPRLQEANDRFRPYAATALDQLKAYLKVDHGLLDNDQGRIITAFNPLLSYFQAYTVTVNGDVYIVLGPQPGEPSPSSYYHEVAHYLIGPIVDKYRSDLDRLAPLLALPQQREGTVSYDVVEESLVRTVDVILSGRLFNSPEEDVRKRIDQEYKLGFILCPYLFESLPAFEASGLSLDEYFPRLIAGIDVARETARWKALPADTAGS